MTKTIHHRQQLGFDMLLAEAAQTNHARRIEKETGHLPAIMADALPFFVALLEEHHAAMLGGRVDETMRLRKEAHRLALRLNGGKAGILADDDSPGCVLARATVAAAGVVPLWGQRGSFIVTAAGARVRVAMDGLFGIGASSGFWLGFSTHAVDLDQSFISETGYRSFLGIHAAPVAGMTPDTFVREVIAAHVRHGLKGRLLPLEPPYSGQAA